MTQSKDDIVPEEYIEHAVKKERVPTIEEEVDELLTLSALREASGDFVADSRGIRESIRERRRRGLLLSFSAMVFVSLGNKILQKLETVPMYNYPNFLNLFSTFIWIPLSCIYIVPSIRYGVITPAQRRVPKKIFAILGLLDAVAGIMQIFAATYISGSLLILLAQSTIPMSMLVSKKLLRTTYTNAQIGGAIVVSLGIFVVLGPLLLAGGGGSSIVWCFIMVLACFPTALSGVYKEIALGETDLDPIYLNGWVSVFQFILSIPLAIPAGLVGNPSVSPSDLPSNIWNGLKCYLGINSVYDTTHPDNCWPGAPLLVTLYLMFNVTYNILLILILKYGSANILFLAMTISIPLGNLAFTLPFISGTTTVRGTDILGLIVIMSGLILYRFGDKSSARSTKAGKLQTTDMEGGTADSLREPLISEPLGRAVGASPKEKSFEYEM